MQRNEFVPEMLSPAVLEALPMRLRGTGPVVRFLRECGAIPEASCVDGAGPVGVLVGEFRAWLADERGLAAATVRGYGNHATRSWPGWESRWTGCWRAWRRARSPRS